MTASKPTTWRQRFRVHPAADLFPMMMDEELAELGEDIKANGLKIPVAVDKDGVLLDGRNRLEAMERVGIEHSIPDNVTIGGDPVTYIISLNIRRRHLTKQQQADLIVAVHKAAEDKPRQDGEGYDGLDLPDFLDRREGGRGKKDEVKAAVAAHKAAADAAGAAEDKPPQVEVVSKGGRGKINKVKAAAIATAKEHGISKATVERSFAKVRPKPRPESKRYTARPLPKPRSGKPVLGLEAARRHYLDQCAGADVDLDAEIDLITGALRELADKRAMADKPERTKGKREQSELFKQLKREGLDRTPPTDQFSKTQDEKGTGR